MKTFIFQKKPFIEQALLLERLIPNRNPNPLLTYLGLVPGKGALTFFGSNGEVDLEVRLPVEGAEEGPRVLVPAAPFFGLLKGLPGEEVHLRLDGPSLELASGRFRTRLGLAGAEDYPQLVFLSPAGESANHPGEGAFPEEVTLEAEDLLLLLTRVRYATSNDEYRGVFRGVLLELRPKGIRAVATDGYRLALFERDEPRGEGLKAIIPGRTVDEMVRLLRGKRGPVTLAFGQGRVGLALRDGEAQIRLAALLMEGEFPDYERVIPKDFVLQATFEAEAMREALKRLMVLADKEAHRVDLLLQGERAVLSAEGAYGRGEEEIPIEAQGKPLSLSYNAKHLLEGLSPIEGRARLGLSGPTSPSLLLAEEERGYQAVVVPLRV